MQNLKHQIQFCDVAERSGAATKTEAGENRRDAMNAELAPAIFLRFFRASVLAGGFGKSWGLDGILAGTNKIANLRYCFTAARDASNRTRCTLGTRHSALDTRHSPDVGA